MAKANCQSHRICADGSACPRQIDRLFDKYKDEHILRQSDSDSKSLGAIRENLAVSGGQGGMTWTILLDMPPLQKYEG